MTTKKCMYANTCEIDSNGKACCTYHTLCAVCYNPRQYNKKDSEYRTGCCFDHSKIIEEYCKESLCEACGTSIKFEECFIDGKGLCGYCSNVHNDMYEHWISAPTRDSINKCIEDIAQLTSNSITCMYGGGCRHEGSVCCNHHVLCAVCFNPRARVGVYTSPGCCEQHTKMIENMQAKQTYINCEYCDALIYYEKIAKPDKKRKNACIACYHEKIVKKECKFCTNVHSKKLYELSDIMRKKSENV